MTDVMQHQPAPRRLAAEAEYVVRLLELAADDLHGKRDCASKAARSLIEQARRTLDAALEADVDAATGELVALVRRALGRDIRAAQLYGARRALELMLDCLPDGRGDGRAAEGSEDGCFN